MSGSLLKNIHLVLRRRAAELLVKTFVEIIGRVEPDHAVDFGDRAGVLFQQIGRALQAHRQNEFAGPGHTEESVCYLIDGEALLTGDTLFVESVGRPDLEKGDDGAEAGARMLYHSQHDRILKLPDDLRIYPAHYGRPIGFDRVPVGALSGELKSELDLLKLDEQMFVRTVLSSLQAKPPNFQRVIAINEGKAELGWIDPLDLEAGPNRCAVSHN